ncbi:MAG TPA: hypothetical protein VK464_28105 [Symbiobacteriaceae bacterium]|nr:hypothetical protein [Symbiobacteriaceae bacterium]
MLHEAAVEWKLAWKDADPVGRMMILYMLLLLPVVLIGSILKLSLI